MTCHLKEFFILKIIIFVMGCLGSFRAYCDGKQQKPRNRFLLILKYLLSPYVSVRQDATVIGKPVRVPLIFVGA